MEFYSKGKIVKLTKAINVMYDITKLLIKDGYEVIPDENNLYLYLNPDVELVTWYDKTRSKDLEGLSDQKTVLKYLLKAQQTSKLRKINKTRERFKFLKPKSLDELKTKDFKKVNIEKILQLTMKCDNKRAELTIGMNMGKKYFDSYFFKLKSYKI